MPDTESDAERLSSHTLHRGRVIDLSVDRVRLPNGRVTELELVHHRGAAAVVPLLEDGRVVLVRQYRYATGGWLLEIPAGKLPGGESPATGAGRELEEETGYRAARLEPLGWIWSSPGFSDEKVWLFLARQLRATQQRLESDEVLTLETAPLPELVGQAERGELQDAKTVCGVLRAAARLGLR